MCIFINAGQPFRPEIGIAESSGDSISRRRAFLDLGWINSTREQRPLRLPVGTSSMRTPKLSMMPGPNKRCRVGRCISGPSFAAVVVKARVSAGVAARTSGPASTRHGTETTARLAHHVHL